MVPNKGFRFRIFLWVMLLVASISCGAIAQDASHASGWIAIPAAKYESLHAKAYPVEPAPEAPKIDATLTRIDYDLRINGDFAAGKATLTVDVLKNGWVKIPIPSSLLIREAKLEGKPVSFVTDEKSPNSKSVVFSRQGRAVLQFDIVLPVSISSSSESITLPPAIAGVTRASVLLPRQGVDMKLTSGFLAEKSSSATECKWVAYGRGKEPLIFNWWRKNDDHRSSQPLRMRGSLTELIGLGEDSTSINAEINAEIIQGAAREIKIKLPDKVSINQVAGAMVADWEMKPGELVVTFLEPVEKNARFIIIGETRTPREGQIDIPLLRLLQVEREIGGAAVEVLGAGEIKDQKITGFEMADASDLGELVSSRQSPSLVAFKFRSGDTNSSRSLSVNVARYTQEAVLMANIEEARYKVMMTDDGKTLVMASYAIRNNQRNFLRLKLPESAIVWSAVLSGKPIRPGLAPDGSLLVPLEKARSGEEAPAFAAELLYLVRGDKWINKGIVKFIMPVLDLPVSRTGLQCFYPSFYRFASEPGAFRTQNYQAPFSTILHPPSGSATINESVAGKTSQLVGNDVLDLVKVMGGVAGTADTKQEKEKAAKNTQALVDKYRAQTQEGKRAGILPNRIHFPEFGPSTFLVSELTAENQAPVISFTYESEKKGVVR
jgi:hypothetical protein